MSMLLSTVMLVISFMALVGGALFWRSVQYADKLKSALSEAHEQAATDALTGLPNRSRMLGAISDMLDGSAAGTLLYIDLDGFKDVNDTLGHAMGDKLLCLIGERLDQVFSGADLFARMGGDEFAALFTGDQSFAKAETTAKKCLEILSEAFVFEEQSLGVSASIGLAPVDDPAMTDTELLRRADVAMYAAKVHAEHNVLTYAAEMDEMLRLRRTLANELSQALDDGGLELVYQPMICARTGQMVSAEALMRWPGKQGQAGSPAVFIPIAEESGLILRLGEWALHQALAEASRLGDVPIAVNVSPLQFRVPGFADSVRKAIEHHGVNPKLLKIEITEGVLISHTAEAQATMQALRGMGVNVLLDDFGTGYSSLSYLQQFEFDGLKIDRAFIRQLDTKKTSRELLRSIVSMGHSLNMKVIAEGVETGAQASLLQLLGCDVLQGYELGRPGLASNLKDVQPSVALVHTGRRV